MTIEHTLLFLFCFINSYFLFLFFLTNRTDIKFLKSDIARLKEETRGYYKYTLKSEYNESDIKRLENEVSKLKYK